jgi:hypothetical protein
MKKSLVAACLLSACALPSFAQSPAQIAGAKLVAEHDASYAKAHSSPYAKATMPMVHHTAKHHAHPVIKKATK